MVRKFINRLIINLAVKRTKARPYPFSLWSPAKIGEKDKKGGQAVPPARYTAWPGLVDRRFTGRHLPPANPDYTENAGRLPPVKALLPLFKRTEFIPCPTSSVLFTFFAQWFTDSFLRTHPVDKRKNTSNHEIDLCQIYGLTEETADILRSEEGGMLRHEFEDENDKDEYGQKLFDEDRKIRKHFETLPYIVEDKVNNTFDLHQDLLDNLDRAEVPPERRYDFYASGLERGNTTIGYSAASTIFRREHNRLCRIFAKQYKNWGDDQLFQTARNVNITLILKIVLEDYINHLTGRKFNFFLDVGFAEKQKWYRTNRIAIEFDLLYRWHGPVPETVELGGQDFDRKLFMYNNRALEKYGVEEVIKAVSTQHAGRIGLYNTPDFLLGAEGAAIKLGRQAQVRSYNDYCRRFGHGLLAHKPARSFTDLTGEQELAGKLAELYDNDIENVELYIGLLAEKRGRDKVFGKLMRTMVSVDAFSHIFTNPLLSGNIYGEDTFSEIGLKIIEETGSFKDIVKRNCTTYDPDKVVASFTYLPPDG